MIFTLKIKLFWRLPLSSPSSIFTLNLANACLNASFLLGVLTAP